MLVAQLTDLHLVCDGAASSDTNSNRFRSCLDTASGLLRQPDLYVITGDITDRGDEEGYRIFLRAMNHVERPWMCVMGNHDSAGSFARASMQEPSPTRQSDDVRIGGWRVLGIDTSLPGLTGGYFDKARADQLAAALAAGTDVPTIIAMHHPPVPTGVEWIDPPAGAGWIKRFGAVVARFPQIRQLVCGHVHMAVMTQFQGIPVSIAPATAPQLWPEMAAFDHTRPDGRMMVVDGAPGFALHRLGENTVATTFCTPSIGRVWLRNDAASVGERTPLDTALSG